MAMSFNEFQEKDTKLLERIAGYQMECEDFRANIAHNNKEIARLQLERTHLRQEYTKEEMESSQRNLQGETIKKTN